MEGFLLLIFAVGAGIAVGMSPRRTQRKLPPEDRPAARPRPAPATREAAQTQPRPQPAAPRPVAPALPERITGRAWVIDGDTIRIGQTNIRLFGIDAPELDHPWGKKSMWEMVRLCKGQTVTAHVTGEMSHARVVARCHLPDGRDLSAELVRAGLAIDWPKYSGGVYRALEPEGIRKRHWRAAARQRGRMPD